MSNKQANKHQRTHFCLVSIFLVHIVTIISPLKINFLLAFTCNFYQGLVHSSKALPPTSNGSNEIHNVYLQPLRACGHHCHSGFRRQESLPQAPFSSLSKALPLPPGPRYLLHRIPSTPSCLYFFSPHSLSLQIIGLKLLPNKSLHVHSPPPAVWSDGGFQNANIIPP